MNDDNEMPWWHAAVETLQKVYPQPHANWVELWADQAGLYHALTTKSCLYKRNFEGLADKENGAALVKWVEDKFHKVIMFSHGEKTISAVYVDDSTMVQVFFNPEDKSFNLLLASRDSGVLDEFIEFSKDKLKKKSDYAGEVYMLGEMRQQFQLYHIGHGGIPIERANYNPETMESYDRMVMHLGAVVPKGRLVIIDGPAGTGKTFFVRGLIEEVGNAVFIYIPAALVPSLDKPSFIPALLEVANENPGPKVLVIEDADALLVRRQADNITGIATLLNITDGTFGDLIDFRVIATTNAKRLEIDKAMKRKGRVLELLTLKELTKDHANTIWTNLTRHIKDAKAFPYTEKMLLGDVYDDAIEMGWEAPSRKVRPYHTVANSPF